MASSNPSLQQLKQAVNIAEKIEKLQQELSAIMGGAGAGAVTGKRKYTKRAVAVDSEEAAPAKKKSKKRTMSPEARAKIAAVQKARWAKVKKEKAKAE